MKHLKNLFLYLTEDLNLHSGEIFSSHLKIGEDKGMLLSINGTKMPEFVLKVLNTVLKNHSVALSCGIITQSQSLDTHTQDLELKIDNASQHQHLWWSILKPSRILKQDVDTCHGTLSHEYLAQNLQTTLCTMKVNCSTTTLG